jgi:8-amino-7-oxononanoate synthase
MIPGEWDELARSVLAGLEAAHLLRRRAVITPIDPTHVLCDGQRLVNFASNNYLGLTHHPRVIEAVERSLRATGAGTGASALISGFGPAHESAQKRIAQWKGTEAAVLLPSGYQANHAAVQTLAAVAEKSSRPVRFLLDKLCHASLIDAVRASGARWRVFPHNALEKVRRLLAEADSEEIQVVVTESIFSMDGDAADLHGLAKLKAERPFVLLLDEAHASGVYGPAGAGLAAELGLGSIVDVTVLTLSKSIGCAGGAVCGSETFCAAMVNLARAYIFSTNLPAMIAAGAEAAVNVMSTEPHLRARVRELARRVRGQLSSVGLLIPPGDSPIIPIVMGSESAALEAANELRADGILVLAIRPPTVPRGASRLRVTLSAGHSDEEVQRLIQAITRVVTRAAGTYR